MTRTVQTFAVFAALALLLPACGGEEEPAKEEPKKKGKPLPPAPVDDTPVAPQFDLTGPKPPETSAVVFAVDGALLPLACFDKAKAKLLAGKECAGLVAEGSEVYMESSFGNKALEKTGAGTKASLCGDAGALPTPGTDGGAAYDWAVWPKSLGLEFKPMSPDTWSDRGAQLEEAEKTAIQAAMAKKGDGEFLSRQKAKVDIDGDGKDELFVSAVLTNPRDPDNYLFSGLFMARGGDSANVVLIDKSSKGTDTLRLRGVVDVDGDGKRELWTSLTFDGGNGDRIVQMIDAPKPVGGWTCGAG